MQIGAMTGALSAPVMISRRSLHVAPAPCMGVSRSFKLAFCSYIGSPCSSGRRQVRFLSSQQVNKQRHCAALQAAVAAPTAITADPWQTLAVLSICAAAAQVLESSTTWGQFMSAPLVALMAALAAAAAGLLPPVSPVYDVVWAYLMPLAVGLYLLEHDVTGLVKSGRQVLAAFLLGAAGMLAGSFCAWQLLGQHLGQHGAQLAACMVASYVGGSVNFAAVATATKLPGALMPGAIAADNLAMLVLLTAMMAVPIKVISNWGSREYQVEGGAATAAAPSLQPAVAAAPAPAASSAGSNSSRSSRSSSTSSTSVSSTAAGPLGLDGSLLETAPPSAAAVAACLEASSRGRQAPGSSSSGNEVHASITTSSQQQSQSQSKRQASRAVGQLALDGAPLLTPDPDQDMQLQQQQQQQQHQQQQQQHHTSAAAAAAAAVGAAGSAAASASAAAVKKAAANCGGCRGSGVTARDHNPLLTAAPGMGDAISTINAARLGQQQLLVAGSDSSSGSSWQPGSPAVDADKGPGCGCCAEALDAIAAASQFPGTAGGSSSSSSSSTPVSGALALDNSPLLTEEPDSLQLAAAVTAAKTGSRGGRISVSDSVSSLSSSDSEEDFELLVKLSWKELQQRLEEQQQQLEEQQAGEAAAAIAAEAAAASAAEKQQSQQRKEEQLVAAAAGSSSGSGMLTGTTAAAALAASVVAAAASHQLAAWLAAPSLQLLLLSGCALALSVAGNAMHRGLLHKGQSKEATTTAAAAGSTAGVSGPFSGSTQLGQLLMGLFFATLGASCCCSASSLAASVPLLAFVGVMVSVHWLLMAGVGPLLGLPGPVLVAGSVANLGGPATAAGLVGGRGWQGLVTPSLLCGSLGYAVGTGVGLLVARGLGVLPA